MLVWLDGIQNTAARAEREPRPRAHGALHARRRARRLHRDRRPRAGAGAHRLARGLARRRRAGRTSASTPARHDAGTKTSSAAPAPSPTTTPPASASSTPPTRRSSSPSCGATSSPTPPDDRDPPARSRRLRRRRLAGRARARGDPQPPRAATTAPRWSSRPSSTPPGCCACSAAAIDTDDWAWRCAVAGQQLFYAAERLRLGRRRAGSTPPRGAARWDIAVCGDRHARRSTLGPRRVRRRPRPPEAAVERVLAWAGAPRSPPSSATALAGLRRPTRSPDRVASLGARPVPRPAPERAAAACCSPAADWQTVMSCTDFTAPSSPREPPGRRGAARDRARHARRPPAPA